MNSGADYPISWTIKGSYPVLYVVRDRRPSGLTLYAVREGLWGPLVTNWSPSRQNVITQAEQLRVSRYKPV